MLVYQRVPKKKHLILGIHGHHGCHPVIFRDRLGHPPKYEEKLQVLTAYSAYSFMFFVYFLWGGTKLGDVLLSFSVFFAMYINGEKLKVSPPFLAKLLKYL